MVEAASSCGDAEGVELLLPESGEWDRSWRLNFEGFRRSERKEKPSCRLQRCFGVFGTGDVVAEYYQRQVEMLEGFNEMDALADHGFLPGMSKEEHERVARGFILWFTALSMQTANPYQYPIGKRRMQPLEDGFSLTKEQEAWVVYIMLAVTLVKLILVVYCRSFTNEIVKAYAQDHFFDVITNVIGLVAALLANYVKDWIDPVGAIILALYTIRTWSMTVLENVNSLVGRSAAPEYLQKLTYLCWNHHQAIRHIDTVRAYTFGSHYFVEVDIVLPSDMPLREAHDIGEALQEKLELLPEIERAFVHLDYEFTHRPEHAQAHDT
uniref:Metal tolerance protein 5 isoform X5 n=1 Tax=Elaeis guineensis var. tenera TaxID=51953 RepID=A0A8N4EXX7_ELAGV|nr:metal tolerance protein 5 isoform X5 [Elaeis guineensis]